MEEELLRGFGQSRWRADCLPSASKNTNALVGCEVQAPLRMVHTFSQILIGLFFISLSSPSLLASQDLKALKALEAPSQRLKGDDRPALHWWPFPTGPFYGSIPAKDRQRTDVIRMAVGSFSIHSPLAFPRDLRGKPTGESAYFLVHFRSGEAMRNSKRELERLVQGALGLDFIQQNTLVFRLPLKALRTVRAHRSVDWVDHYHPGFKLSPALEPLEMRPGQDPPDDFLFAITLFQPESLEATMEALRQFSFEVTGKVQNTHRKTLYVQLSEPELPRVFEIAQLEPVRFIEPLPIYLTMNSNTDQVLQSGAVGSSTPFWEAGIRGTNQIVAAMDSGLDVDTIWFAHTQTDAGVPGPTHRKVLSYEAWGEGTVGTCSCVVLAPFPRARFSFSHGTLATANILANRQDFGLSDIVEGMAPGARIHFQDIGNSSGSFGTCDFGSLFPPNDLTLPFQDARDRGAFVHNDSWGTAQGNVYPVSASDVDAFLWAYPDFTILLAAGDCGPESGGSCPSEANATIGTPGTAKNDITVGATDQDPAQEDVAGFSSRGPETVESGRFGPTVMMVGVDTARVHSIPSINGAQDLGTDCGFGSGDCDISGPPGASCVIFGIQGTSNATSYATGALLLIRDYLAQGFYPTGAANAADAVPTPSGPLLKALMINSADFMTGSGAGVNRVNNDQGYGRVQLSHTLPLAGNPQTPTGLVLWDRALEEGLGVSQTSRDHYFRVDDTGREVRVALAYYDAPSGAGTAGTLINDLSLTVTDPAGNVYRGNHFSGPYSIPDSGVEDTQNPTETVVIDPTELVIGTYTATVSIGAGGIREDHPGFGGQPYALVASGNLTQLRGLGSVPGNPLNPGTPLTITLEGTRVILTWAASCLDQDYAVYRGNVADLPTNSTASAALVTRSTGGQTSAADELSGAAVFYVVVPNDGVLEGSYGQNSPLIERPQSVNSPYTQVLDACVSL